MYVKTVNYDNVQYWPNYNNYNINILFSTNLLSFVSVQFRVKIRKKFKASPWRLDLTFPGTWRLTLAILPGVWPLRFRLESGHCDSAWRLALAIPPGGWPLQSLLEAGPCDPIWRLALRSHLAAGPCDPTWRLALAIPPGDWPLQSHIEACPYDPTWRLALATTWRLVLAIPAIFILPGSWPLWFHALTSYLEGWLLLLYINTVILRPGPYNSRKLYLTFRLFIFTPVTSVVPGDSLLLI